LLPRRNLRFQVSTPRENKRKKLFAPQRVKEREGAKGNALAGSCGVEWIYLQLGRGKARAGEAYFEMFATDNHNKIGGGKSCENDSGKRVIKMTKSFDFSCC
jgi:hypothetical protein